METVDQWGKERDEVVLKEALQNPELFRILVQRYQEPFLRKAATVVRDSGESEDIVQETFVKIYRYAANFKKQPGIEFKSWAYKILMHTAFTHYAKIKKTRTNVEYLDFLLTDSEELAKDETYLEKAELKNVVAGVLDKMPTPLATALKAYYFEDKSYEMIAKEQKISLSALKMRLFRAKKVFRKLLEI